MPHTNDITVTLGDDAARVDTLPASAGVIAFEGADGATVLLAATGDLRRFARSRLGLDPDAAPTRADLRGVTTRLVATRVGASFEGDVVYLREARRRLPATYRAGLDMQRAWCVHLDADAPTPVWRKFDAAAAAEGQPATSGPVTLGNVIGPAGDKDAAGRLGESLDDLFDLCRYPRELEKAPTGQACAYKEMGRCGGACDGSETMDAYRGRVREACGFVARPVRLGLSALEGEMSRAADAEDFEQAAALRDRLERSKRLGKPSLKWARRLDRLSVLAVQPSPRRGWARLFRCDANGIEAVGDASGKIDAPGAEALLGSILSARAPSRGERLSLEIGEQLGVLAQHMYHPRRGSGRLVDLDEPIDAPGLCRHIRAAARIRRPSGAAGAESGGRPGERRDEGPEREIGG